MPPVVFRATLALTLLLGGCMPASTAPEWSVSDDTPAAGQTAVAAAPETESRLPALVVSDEPPPTVIYRRGSRDAMLAPESDSAPRGDWSKDTRHIETVVTQKAASLSREFQQLEDEIDSSGTQLAQLQTRNDDAAAEYYALVGAISAELQAGTTRGNPILVDQWHVAQDKLNAISQDSGLLNALATDLTNQATRATYLLEATQTAFSISGAVPEDHKKLNVIEDGIEQSIALINRHLSKVNDEISRRTSYMRAERANLQTLSLGIANGDLYGQNLTNTLFRKMTSDGSPAFKGAASPAVKAAPAARRPLVIIRFDRPNVSYEQPLYAAVNQALEKYPAARFELVAVSNLEGNAAQLALASAEARKNGEAVLRALSQMGVPMERVRLTAASGKNVINSEVHLYLQ